MEHIRDSAVFETYAGGYVFAEDNGYFTVGEVRDERMYSTVLFRLLVHKSSGMGTDPGSS